MDEDYDYEEELEIWRYDFERDNDETLLRKERQYANVL